LGVAAFAIGYAWLSADKGEKLFLDPIKSKILDLLLPNDDETYPSKNTDNSEFPEWLNDPEFWQSIFDWLNDPGFWQSIFDSFKNLLPKNLDDYLNALYLRARSWQQPVDPLALDLDGDGIEAVGVSGYGHGTVRPRRRRREDGHGLGEGG
jgi:hypothetical protein